MNISVHELMWWKMHNHEINLIFKLKFALINRRILSYDLCGKMIFLEIYWIQTVRYFRWKCKKKNWVVLHMYIVFAWVWCSYV